MHLCICTNKIKAVEVLVKHGCHPSRFPTLLTGPLYTDSKEFKNPHERMRMLSYLLKIGFRRPRDILEIAINSAITNGRVLPEHFPELQNLVNQAYPGSGPLAAFENPNNVPPQ